MGKQVCGWCKRVLGDAPGLPNGEVTHGLCERCKAEQLAIVEPELEQAEQEEPA